MRKSTIGTCGKSYSASYWPMTKLLLPFVFLAASLGAQTFLPLDVGSWTLSGIQKPPKLQAINGALAFDFGKKIGNAANYLTTGTAPFGTVSAISFTVQVLTTGSPIFQYDTERTNTCIFPAHARMYFEADSSVWTNSAGDTFRWWANPIAVALGPGMVGITVQLRPDQFSTVFGRFGNSDAESLAGFQASLSNTALIGLTFGGGCFFGHGGYVKGGTAH